jgi:hypothetical protein
MPDNWDEPKIKNKILMLRIFWSGLHAEQV